MTIIGVVAALTIPTLMGKYQDQSLKSQFKKSYTIISQALSLTTGYECYYRGGVGYTTSDCKTFWPEFEKKLKVSKKEKVLNCPYKQTQDEIKANGGGFLNTNCGTMCGHTWNYKLTLTDGNILYIPYYDSNFFQGVNLVLDVNGEKGPNKWGHDVFFLTIRIRENSSLAFEDGLCPLWEAGGTRPRNIILGTDEISTDLGDWK